MTEPQPPGIVAAADLSPISPSPLYTASPTFVPTLQDSADSLDVATLEPTTSVFAHPGTATMTTAAEPAEASDTIVVGGADQDSHDESMVDEVSSDVYAEGDSASQAQVLDSTGTGVLVPAAASNDPSPSTSMDLDMQTGSFEAPVDVAPAQEAPANATSAAVPKASRDVANAPASSSSSSSSASDSDSDLDEADNDDVAQDHDPAEIASANEALGSAGEPQAARAPSGHDAASEQPNQQDAADAMSDNDSAGSIDSADIQKMVDDMSARAAASSAKQSSTLPAPPAQPFPSPAGASQPASLPPKPSLPAQAAQFAAGNRASPSFDPNSLPAALKALNYPGHPAASISATTPGALPGSGAPGTSSDASLSLPPPPPAQFNGHAPPPFPVMSQHYPANTGTGSADANHGTHQDEQTYEQFIADERRYMAEAKWERFPEGSRIFVGNLSAEKVSKRDVFDLFHLYGRLAQISLKSAFGFVQYHTLEDAEGAVRALQGALINGRKLNLEFSRTQKRDNKGERDRDRSPDRARGGKGGGRGTDRYDGREQGGRRSRDGYRPDRSPEPARRDSGGYGRSAYDAHDRSRNRSRSPRGHSRQESDQYRRRSPSPYRRPQADPAPDRLDIPRRYGSDVPDVQLLLLQEVQREFVAWVQKAFYDRGLKSDVMFLNPRFARDAVIQRQVLEGVHGVIELDARAQGTGTISLQVFNRSAGAGQVSFDQYQGLDPKIAAELVLRAKQQTAPQHAQPPPAAYQPPSYAAAPYQPPAPQQPQYTYPPVAPQQQQQQQQQPVNSAADLSSLVSQLDPASLQRLIASLQGGNTGAAGAQLNMAAALSQQAVAAPRPSMPQQNQGAFGQQAPPQIDVNAILASLKNTGAAAAPVQQARPTAYAPPSYAAPQTGLPAGATPEQQQQVENIMATLAKFRQR